MLTFQHAMLDLLPRELIAKYLPPGRRLLMYRTCKAIKHFLESLANNKPQCLRLSISVRLITRPKHLPTLFAALSQKFRIEGLDMRGTKIIYHILREFCFRKSIDWGHLRSVYIGDHYICPTITDIVVGWLQRCHNLTATDFFGRIQLSNAAWALARRCEKLEFNLLSPRHAQPETFADELCKCAHVKDLDLSENGGLFSRSPEKVRDALGKLKELRAVSFAGSNPSQDVMFMMIEGCSASQATLQRMDLSNMVMVESTARALGVLLRGCENLWDLNLNNTSLCWKDVQGFTHGLVLGGSGKVEDILPKMTHLRMANNIMLREHNAMAVVAALLHMLPGLLHLEMLNSSSAAFLEQLKQCPCVPRMQHLDVSCDFSKSQHGLCFAEMHPKMNALTELIVEHWSSTENARLDSVTHLAPVVQGCPRLRVLDLNNFGFDHAASVLLARSLAGLERLQVLRLSNGRLEEAALPEIFRLLNTCVVETLALQNTRIDAHGLKAGLEAVEGSCELRDLDLSRNPFEEAGAAILAQAQHKFPKLVRLNLSGCALGDRGVQVLPRWPSLLYLRVACNGIGDDGGRALGEAQLAGRWQLECPGNRFKRGVKAALQKQGCKV